MGKVSSTPSCCGTVLMFWDYLFGHEKVGMRRGRGAVWKGVGTNMKALCQHLRAPPMPPSLWPGKHQAISIT